MMLVRECDFALIFCKMAEWIVNRSGNDPVPFDGRTGPSSGATNGAAHLGLTGNHS